MVRFWKLTLAIICVIFEGACSLASLDGTTARITAITLAPETASVPSGTIQRFSAVATFNDGTTRDVTDEVDWGAASTNRGLITMVSGVKGGVRALQVGDESVTAVSSNGIAGVASLTVTPATLVKVVVTGDYHPSFRALTKSFTATGVFTDGSTQDISEDATWAISDTDIMIGSGVSDGAYGATLVSPGAATVSATYQGITGSTEVVVANASLVTLEVEAPESFTSLPAGYFVPLSATGTYSDGTVMDLTSAVTWASNDDATATVSNDTGYYGRVTGVVPGTVSITATIDGVSDSLSVTVTNATLASIAMSQSSVTTYKPLKTELTATGTFSDASTLDITKSVTWSSAHPTIATVSIDDATMGEVTAVKQGTTTITATKSEVSATTTFLVLHYELQSIAITLSSSSQPEGFPQTATAIATFSDGTTVDVTEQVTWTSSNGTAVFPSPTDPGTLIGGEVDANYSSSGDVTASLGGVTSSPAPVAVVEATLASITISPESPSVSVGGTSSLTATGNFSNETTLPLTRFVKWTSSARAYATVKNSPAAQKGTVTGVAIGSSTISAKWNSSTPNVTGSATLAVDGAPGSLDESYGFDGTILLSNARVPHSDDSNPTHIHTALQSDDKLLVAAPFHDAGGDRYLLQLIRYTSDGDADLTFDGDSGSDNGVVRVAIGAGSTYPRAVALQSDGKIVVVGVTGTGAFVARFNSDGSTDSDFGTSGVSIVANSDFYAVSAVSEGKILAAGTGENGKGLFARFTSSGSLDSAFGSAGLCLTTATVTLTDMVVRPNGKAVGMGANYLIQVTANGSVDSDFDGVAGWNGEIPLTVASCPSFSEQCLRFVESLGLESDGSVVIGGGGRMGDGTWFASAQLLRVDVNGNFDTEFMAEETGLDDLAPFQRLAEGLTFFGVDFNGNSRDGGQYGRYRASFSSLKPHPDGTTIGLMTPHLWSYAGAYTGSGEGHFGSDVRSAYIVRFTRTGFDHSFGTEGVSTVGFSSSIDRALDIQVQSDGRIVGVAQLGNGGYQASAGLAQLVFFRVWD